MDTIERNEQHLRYLRVSRRVTHGADELQALEEEILQCENENTTLKAQRDRLPPSRAHAKAMRKRYYFDGSPCAQGHIAKHLTRNYECMRCRKIAEMKRRRKLSEQIRVEKESEK